MARGKKKESALTPEEKLAQALVPDWEWPYKVPKNWIWSYIRTGYEVTSSKRVHKDDWLSEGVPFYRTRELVKLSEHGYVDNELFISEEQYEEYKTAYGVPQMGDLLISGVGTIGVPYIVNSEEKFYFKDGNIIWFKNKGLFLPEYIYFLYKSLFMDNQIHEMSSGTTVDTYTIINANNTMVPAPPLAEQQRIVDRIEYLFGKLDEAKEKAQSVLDSFETRKAAILHKAFTGELTAKWRAEHGLDMGSWATRSLKNCGSWYGGGTPSTTHPEYWENGTLLWITSKDMKSDLIEDTLMHTTMLGVENSSANYIEEPAILFVMRSGILRRTFPVCMVKKPFTVNQDLKALVPNDIDLEYLFWACKAAEKEILEKCMKSGTTVESINASALQNFLIPVAGKEEQSEIVHILDSLFAKEQQAKEAAEAVLYKIDLLKKSILARAFRGELGTNDPTEESAKELLKRILGLPLENKAPAKRVFIPKDIENRINTELERKIVKLFLQKNTAVMPVSKLMSASSKKFDVMEALRNLQQRGILVKEKDTYKLLR